MKVGKYEYVIYIVIICIIWILILLKCCFVPVSAIRCNDESYEVFNIDSSVVVFCIVL